MASAAFSPARAVLWISVRVKLGASPHGLLRLPALEGGWVKLRVDTAKSRLPTASNPDWLGSAVVLVFSGVADPRHFGGQARK